MASGAQCSHPSLQEDPRPWPHAHTPSLLCKVQSAQGAAQHHLSVTSEPQGPPSCLSPSLAQPGLRPGSPGTAGSLGPQCQGRLQPHKLSPQWGPGYDPLRQTHLPVSYFILGSPQGQGQVSRAYTCTGEHELSMNCRWGQGADSLGLGLAQDLRRGCPSCAGMVEKGLAHPARRWVLCPQAITTADGNLALQQHGSVLPLLPDAPSLSQSRIWVPWCHCHFCPSTFGNKQEEPGPERRVSISAQKPAPPRRLPHTALYCPKTQSWFWETFRAAGPGLREVSSSVEEREEMTEGHYRPRTQPNMGQIRLYLTLIF